MNKGLRPAIAACDQLGILFAGFVPQGAADEAPTAVQVAGARFDA